MSVMCGLLCSRVSYQKYNMPFNDSSGNYSLTNPPQYSTLNVTYTEQFTLERYPH